MVRCCALIHSGLRILRRIVQAFSGCEIIASVMELSYRCCAANFVGMDTSTSELQIVSQRLPFTRC